MVLVGASDASLQSRHDIHVLLVLRRGFDPLS
jgi:hypothetical protein